MKGVGLAANKLNLNPQWDNPTNVRLHIQFFHSGCFIFPPEQANAYKEVLNAIWKKFGMLTDTYYHNEFSYCFVSFSTHAQAEAALTGINNSTNLRSILKTFDNAQARPAIEALFVRNPNPCSEGEELACASWAAPRPSRGTFAYR
jgi:hypothetical protein